MKVNYFNNLGLISTVNTGICVHVRKLIKNQVLRKLVKLHNLVNVNQYDYINVSRHSRFLSWVSFFALKLKVSLKISLKFPLALFDDSEGCFTNCLLNSVFGIDICLCD